MIQRIQTIYLTLAAIACIVCLCLPIGRFIDASGMVSGTLYNLWISIPSPVEAALATGLSEPVLAQEAADTHVFTPWALFVLLVLNEICLAISGVKQDSIAAIHNSTFCG